MSFNDFIQTVRTSFSDITPAQEEAFRSMEKLYGEWNAKINVISRKDIDSLYIRHVLHSLALPVI